MIYFELIGVLVCLLIFRKNISLPTLSVVVNWLFCLYIVEMSEGIFVSNKKYFEVGEDPASFLAYFIHIAVFIPSVVLTVINMLQTRRSTLAKLGIILIGSAVLNGGEYLLSITGAVQHKRINVVASYTFWLLLIIVSLTFHKLLHRKVQRV